jgi:hypothetical protein
MSMGRVTESLRFFKLLYMVGATGIEPVTPSACEGSAFPLDLSHPVNLTLILIRLE